jgi:phosphoglycolate phosphatase
MFGQDGESAPMLLLFDIDGTLLLRASRPHRDALHGALTAVYGLADPAAHRVDAAGRTDRQITREILNLGGFEAGAFEARLEEFERDVVARFAALCPDNLADCLAPGIEELLEALAADPSIRLSLLTGNLEPIARIKLERAGIGRFFVSGQGAFGSDAEDRRLLGPIARSRAGTPGEPYPREATTVIGDTPLDIACARADGLRIIAVTTGPYDALALYEADAIAQDAPALQALLLG